MGFNQIIPGPPGDPSPCTYHNYRVSVSLFSQVCKVSYPVGSQFDLVWVAIRIPAKFGMSDTATQGVAILDDHKVVNGRIGQSLLQIAHEYRVAVGSRGYRSYCRSDPGHTTSSAVRKFSMFCVQKRKINRLTR